MHLTVTFEKGQYLLCIEDEEQTEIGSYGLSLSDLELAAISFRKLERLNYDAFVEATIFQTVLSKIEKYAEAISLDARKLKAVYLAALMNHLRETNLMGIRYADVVQELTRLVLDQKGEPSVEILAIPSLIEAYTERSFSSLTITPEEREETIRGLIHKACEGPLIQEERDKGLPTLVRCHRWFLERYDTRNARWLNNQIAGSTGRSGSAPVTDDHDDDASEKEGEGAAKPESPLPEGNVEKTELKIWLPACVVLSFLLVALRWNDAGAFCRITRLLWGGFLYFIPVVGTAFIVLGKQTWYQSLLPRLLAGTILGYLLLLSNEAWQGTIELTKSLMQEVSPFTLDGLRNWLYLMARILLPSFVCLAYLTIEINNAIRGRRPRSRFAARRALCIFFQGLFYALYLGVLFSDLFGDGLLNYQGEPVCPFGADDRPSQIEVFSVPGCFGHLYSLSIFMLSPLALFIGIFSQILWEEKPITHPV